MATVGRRNTATRLRRKRPAPREIGVIEVLAGAQHDLAAAASQPRGLMNWWGSAEPSVTTRPFSRRVCSTITTASARRGIGAPVMIRPPGRGRLRGNASRAHFADDVELAGKVDRTDGNRRDGREGGVTVGGASLGVNAAGGARSRRFPIGELASGANDA